MAQENLPESDSGDELAENRQDLRAGEDEERQLGPKRGSARDLDWFPVVQHPVPKVEVRPLTP